LEELVVVHPGDWTALMDDRSQDKEPGLSGTDASLPQPVMLEAAGNGSAAVVVVDEPEVNGGRTNPDVLTLALLDLQRRYQEAERLLDEARAEKKKLEERVSRLNKSGKAVLREVQERSEAEKALLEEALQQARHRIVELSDLEPQQQLTTLRVALHRSQDALQDLKSRYETLVLREKSLREDNHRLSDDLQTLSQRMDSVSRGLGAQVSALTGILESQAAVETAGTTRKQRRAAAAQVLPSLVMAPLGLMLCQPATESFLKDGWPLPKPDQVALAGGMVLFLIAVVWAFLHLNVEHPHGN
jgi:hypothetical protein